MSHTQHISQELVGPGQCVFTFASTHSSQRKSFLAWLLRRHWPCSCLTVGVSVAACQALLTWLPNSASGRCRSPRKKGDPAALLLPLSVTGRDLRKSWEARWTTPPSLPGLPHRWKKEEETHGYRRLSCSSVGNAGLSSYRRAKARRFVSWLR